MNKKVNIEISFNEKDDIDNFGNELVPSETKSNDRQVSPDFLILKGDIGGLNYENDLISILVTFLENNTENFIEYFVGIIIKYMKSRKTKSINIKFNDKERVTFTSDMGESTIREMVNRGVGIDNEKE